MARNIEIKARIASVADIVARVTPLADKGPMLIVQDDAFYRCPSGRLKLRIFSPDDGELIFYRRADQAGPKESFYVRTPTSSPLSLGQTLAMAYGEIGRVRKRRTLFLVGRSRVHLDVVEGLGEFLELEVVLRDREPAEEGVREAERLMSALGIASSQLIERAYVDLLAEQKSIAASGAG
jgi:predicted adenylyl cyclase CyaB